MKEQINGMIECAALYLEGAYYTKNRKKARDAESGYIAILDAAERVFGIPFHESDKLAREIFADWTGKQYPESYIY